VSDETVAPLANRRMGDVGHTASSVGKLMSGAFSLAAKGAAIGAAAIGVGLLAVAKQGLNLASDLQEVQNVVRRKRHVQGVVGTCSNVIVVKVKSTLVLIIRYAKTFR
jgi:hypothetical protein